MYNQPWNRKVNGDMTGKTGKVIRVYNLYHAIDVLRDLNNGQSKK